MFPNNSLPFLAFLSNTTGYEVSFILGLHWKYLAFLIISQEKAKQLNLEFA